MRRLEIQSLFDAQIEGVMKQTMDQLNWLSDNGKAEQVVCLSHQVHLQKLPTNCRAGTGVCSSFGRTR